MGTKSKKRVGALALCAAIGCSALCAGSGSITSITSLRAKTGTAEAEAEAQTHENALSEQNEIPENANYAADVQYYMGAAAKVAQVGDQSLVENHLTRGADYFDGIRWINDTNQSGKADTEWWGFATVTMGLTDGEQSFDFADADVLQLEVNALSGSSCNWMSLWLVDKNGSQINVNGNDSSYASAFLHHPYFYGTANGTEVSRYVSPSSDGRGVYIDGHGYLELTKDLFTGEFAKYNGATEFDFSNVTALAVRYHSYDAKALETGKVTLIRAEKQTVLFDPSAATQITQWQNRSAIAAIKNSEWYYGPAWWRMDESHTYEEFLSGLGSAMAYQVYQKDFADKAVWNLEKAAKTTNTQQWLYIQAKEYANGAETNEYSDMTNYAGITFELDTTALISESVSIDVTVFDENNTAYRSWGNVGHATYVSEDESAKTNADEGIGANTFKKGFKGKVYMPFSVFEKADKDYLADSSLFSSLYFVINSHSFAVGDKMTIGNISAYRCDHADEDDDGKCDACYAAVNRYTLVTAAGVTHKSVETTKNLTLAADEAENKTFLGWAYEENGEKKLMNAGEYTGKQNKLTFTAINASFLMKIGASVKIKGYKEGENEKSGIRWCVTIDEESFALLSGYAEAAAFGTIVTSAESAFAGKKLDIPTQKYAPAADGVKEYQSVMTDVPKDNFSTKFTGRGYVTITYSDGATATYFAAENDNERSIAEVAESAYNDRSSEQSEKYAYEADGGYSPYPAEDLAVLKKLAGI